MAKRTSAAEKAASGNPGKRRIREPLRPEIAAEVPGPPDWLKSPRALELWSYWAPKQHRLGLLTELDDGLLGRFCDISAKYELVSADLDEHGFIEETAAGSLKLRPTAPLLATYGLRLETMGRKLGMSPQDRNGIDARVLENSDVVETAQEKWRREAAELAAKKAAKVSGD